MLESLLRLPADSIRFQSKNPDETTSDVALTGERYITRNLWHRWAPAAYFPLTPNFHTSSTVYQMDVQQAAAPQDIRNVINFLRGSKSGLKNKTGVLNGSRREYFKGMCSLHHHVDCRLLTSVQSPAGKSAIKALHSTAYAKLKNVPPIDPTDDSARTLLHSMIQYTFFLGVDRGNPSGTSSSSPRHIQIMQQQAFEPDAYYVWFYDGPQWKTYVGAALLVIVMLAGVMFPLWPRTLRIGAWYLSMAAFGVVGLFIALSIFRLIFYIITVVVKSPGIWIFPKLFADVGFVSTWWHLPVKLSKL